MNQTPPFDAYHELLGIAPSEQPPTLYRLLGVTPFESTATVIERAADRQMAHLRTFQIGKHQADSQRLLSEVTRAKQVLLNDQERTAYDAKLRKQQTPAPAAKPLKVAQVLPTPAAPVLPVQSAQPVPVAAVSVTSQAAKSQQPFAANPLGFAPQTTSRPTIAKKQSSNTLLIGGVAAVALVTVVGLLMAMSGRNTPQQPIAQKPDIPQTAPEPAIPGPPQPPVAKPSRPVDPPMVASEPEVPSTTPIPQPPIPTPTELTPAEISPPPIPVAPTPAVPSISPPPANDLSKVRAEVTAAREALQTLPNLKKVL